jgi:hypothetical protein
MRIFGGNIGITTGDSESLASGSIYLNTPIPGITFLYSDGGYGNMLSTGSIASIDTVLTSTSPEGPSGELVFSLKPSSNLSNSGSVLMRLSHSGSDNDPRVGVGFDLNEPILTPFDVKSKQNSAEGTEIFLRSSRTDRGANIGDSAGSLTFLIDSGSFNTGSKEQFAISGSIAKIDSEVTSISDSGVAGHLKFDFWRDSTSQGNLWRMGYGADPSIPGAFGSTTSGSINIVKSSEGSSPVPSLTFTQTNVADAKIRIYNHIKETIPNNLATYVASFDTSESKGAIIEYILYYGTTGSRVGQLYLVFDGTNTPLITDIAAPGIGTGGTPSFTVDGTTTVGLLVTNGQGYIFKGLIKEF